MTIRLSLAVLIGAAFLSSAEVRAYCSLDDFACQKFGSNGAKNASKPRPRVRIKRAPRKTRRTVVSSNQPITPVAIMPIKPKIDATNPLGQPLKKGVSVAAPIMELTRLQPGAIQDAPKDPGGLIFGADDKVEVASATCRLVEHSTRRITCAVAVHSVKLTSNIGAGCTGTLSLRNLEFVKGEDGRWMNEDSISICGGRLLRQAELFPVAINGTPRYALREEYQMLSGDRACAAPYLRSRQPLSKSYMPANAERSRNSLRCGVVAAR